MLPVLVPGSQLQPGVQESVKLYTCDWHDHTLLMKDIVNNAWQVGAVTLDCIDDSSLDFT